MTNPHFVDACGIAEDLVAALAIDDASGDFGEGAIVASCACGAWVIESADGEILAWSSTTVVARETVLAGAA